MSCRVHVYPGIALGADLARRNLLDPDFEHHRVDSVGFLDRRVQRLAELLNSQANLDLVRREDSSMRDIDVNVARILDLVKGPLDEAASLRSVCLDELFAAKRAVQETTHAFFLRLVDEAEAELLDRGAFEQLYEGYRERPRSLLDGLDRAYGRVLAGLDQHQ